MKGEDYHNLSQWVNLYKTVIIQGESPVACRPQPSLPSRTSQDPQAAGGSRGGDEGEAPPWLRAGIMT